MAGTTSVPPPVFTPTGLIIPAESDVLAGAVADLNAAFGGGLNPALETPQGQLASSLTAIVGSKNSTLLALVNQFDPAFAYGRMQDALARIYFLTRNPAKATVVTGTCVGRIGTVIPAGALAKAADGNLYACVTGGAIPSSGTIDLQFACTVTGPIACTAGSLAMYQTITGWDTVTNAADGVLGVNVEGRMAFETRRQNSVSINSMGPLGAIKGAVLQVPGVLDCYATENNTSAAVTIGGVSIAAKSIYVAVVGGNANAVAAAILSRKGPGAGYVGTTTVTITDTNGYSVPYPTYPVKFQIPAPTATKFAVSIANSSSVPANATALIQAAIISAFAGTDNGPRAQIGGTMFSSRYYPGIAKLGSWARIVDILIGTVTPTLHSLTLNIDLVPVVSATDITVSLV